MATAISPNTPGQRKEKASAAAARIIPAKGLKTPLRAVVYGRNGTGKTFLAGTTGVRTLLVDCEEEGYETLEGAEGVDIFPLKKWEEKDAIYWHLKAGKHPYEFLFVDTITMLATLCMKWILGDEASRDSSMDPQMPDKRHYGKLGEAMSNMIIEWRNLPVNIIFLAQERVFTIRDENEEVVGTEIGPSLTPKPLSTLLGAVGTVGRLYKREIEKTVKGKTTSVVQRRLLVEGNDKFMAKTRIKGLKKVVIDPRIDRLMAIRNQAGEVADGLVAGKGVEL